MAQFNRFDCSSKSQKPVTSLPKNRRIEAEAARKKSFISSRVITWLLISSKQLQPIALVHKFALVLAGRLEREDALQCDIDRWDATQPISSTSSSLKAAWLFHSDYKHPESSA